EFYQNVRILENQKEAIMNEIRYALKLEEMRKEKRKEERAQKDREDVKRAKDKTKNDAICHNCGKRGHVTTECYECKEPKHYKEEEKEPIFIEEETGKAMKMKGQ
ncbi:hypothetical protein WN48_09715, partial [Eufriesea mexicana]